MTPLEQRYRSLLRVLPRGYRERWAEDMVDTFLLGNELDDDEDTEFQFEHGRPSGAEVRSVLGLAVRLRLGLTGGIPRYLAVGSAVRLFAVAGLLLHAAIATVDFAWLAVGTPEYLGSLWTGYLLNLGYLPVLLALLAGYRRWASALGALVALGFLARLGTELVVVGAWLGTATDVTNLFAALAPIAALAAFRDGHRVRYPLRWLSALPCACAVVVGTRALGAVGVPLLGGEAYTVLLVLGAVAALIADRFAVAEPDPTPTLAAAMLTGLYFVGTLSGILLSVFDGSDVWSAASPPGLGALWLAQGAVLLRVAVLSARASRRSLAAFPHDADHVG